MNKELINIDNHDFINLLTPTPKSENFTQSSENSETISTQDTTEWKPIRYFRDKYHISDNLLKKIYGDGPTLDQGKPVRKISLYDSGLLDNLTLQFLSLPKLDSETNRFVDQTGDSWIGIAQLNTDYQTSYPLLYKLLENVPSQVGRSKMGMKVKLFPEELARGKLNEFLSIPQMNEGKYYRDENGTLWTIADTLSNLLGVSADKLNSYLDSSNTIEIRGAGPGGRICTGYNVEEIKSKIGSFINLPKAEDYGDKKVNAQSLAQMYGMSVGYIKRLLKELNTTTIRGVSGQKIEFYETENALKLLDDIAALPKVDENGVFIDHDGIRWSTAYTLSQKVGVAQMHLAKRIENEKIQRICGRSKINQQVLLYKESEVINIYGQRKLHPKVIHDESSYIDPDGYRWLTTTALSQTYGLSKETIEKRLARIQSQKVYASNGKLTLSYKFDDAENMLSVFGNLPKIDKKSNEYTDQNGCAWISKTTLIKKLIERGIKFKNLSFKPQTLSGRDLTGKQIDLYNFTEILTHFQDVQPLQKLNAQSIFLDENGIEWAPAGYFIDNKIVNGYTTPKNYAKDLPKLKLLGKGNQIITAYPIVQLTELLISSNTLDKYKSRSKPFRQQTDWINLSRDPELLKLYLESEAKKAMDNGVRITFSSLESSNLSYLASAIHKYYPGGIKGIRLAIGVKVKETRKWENTDIRTQDIKNEALEYLTTYRELNPKSMSKNGFSNLQYHINRHYPGRFPQLRIDLGVTQRRLPNDYWTKENIFAKVQEIFAQEGNFTYGVAEKIGDINLMRAIRLKYPGGLMQLRVDLGIEGRKDNYWSIEKIEDEARIFYNEHKIFTHAALEQHGRWDLKNAIHRRFPGRMLGLQEKLGINVDSKVRIKIDKNQANEQLKNLLET